MRTGAWPRLELIESLCTNAAQCLDGKGPAAGRPNIFVPKRPDVELFANLVHPVAASGRVAVISPGFHTSIETKSP